MKDTIYIVFSRHKVERMLKTRPAIGDNEYLFALDVEVPDSVFKAPPTPVVKIVLDGAAIQPAAVTINGAAQVLPENMDKSARVQAEMLKHLANMIVAGRKSDDPDVYKAADDALDDLLAAGVDVKIEDGKP